MAESFQLSLALKDLQNAVNDIPNKWLEPTELNAVLLGAVLLNVLAFALPDSDSALGNDNALSVSWVFSQPESWLTLQAGLGPLVMSMSPKIEDALSFASQVFLGTHEEEWVFNISQRIGLYEVPERWVRFFDLRDPHVGWECHPDHSKEDNEDYSRVYRAPVAVIVKLRTLRPTRFNAFRTLQFLGKCGSEFRSLLSRGERKAVWLLGYWFGLLSRFHGLWWCEHRMERDYRAVYMYLQQRCPPEEPNDIDESGIWGEMMKELNSAGLCDVDT
ncbi:hypothetical protein LTR37_009583 [Vermiconidia calcicola]|uniref:Uncharacterized protein n=1 Tax=Vermiconidia calcicola TaxID=1690605 RepID=A0ACC3N7V3_9PEZI|nr:hypothetical protein LTR37_009583 [Vermiconidia calcicola]